MADNPPDFSAQLDPRKFHDQDTDRLNSELSSSSAAVGGIDNDWSSVKSMLAGLASGQSLADARAGGEGLTGAAATRLGQQDLGASDGSSGGLGQALLRLGSKLSTQQNMQAGQAQDSQQMQALKEATQLRMQTAEQQRQMFKANLELDNQKFAMQRGAKQAQDGLELFNVHLENMFNQAVAGAKNAQELAQIKTNQINFAQTMQYLTLGMGAVSAASAGAAAIAAKNTPQKGYASDADFVGPPTPPADPTINLPSQSPALQSAGYDFSNAPQPGAGPNGLGSVQSFFNQSPRKSA